MRYMVPLTLAAYASRAVQRPSPPCAAPSEPDHHPRVQSDNRREHQRPTLTPPDSGRILRHAAVDLHRDMLHVYYSRIGDRPERILLSEVPLSGDWSRWRASEPVTVLGPERDYEGEDQPLEASRPDDAPGRVRQLRDPAIFKDGRKTYLLYSIAGESGLAIAQLRE